MAILKLKNTSFTNRKKSNFNIWCNIDRTVVSTKLPFGKEGFKYFIWYKNDEQKVMPLPITLLKMNPYRRDSDGIKYMILLIKDNQLEEIYNKIWDKISKVIKKGFESEHVCNEKHLKTKIKSYKARVNTNCHNDKMT